MDTLPLPFSHDHAVFDFSALPVSPIVPTGAALVPAPTTESASDGLDVRPVFRTLLPWITAQVAAAIGLGTCLAQAMPPTPAKPMLADELHFALRLGDAPEAVGPIPSGIRDGFHLRFSAND